MDFGRTTNVDRIDFALPPEPESNVRALARSDASAFVLLPGLTAWSDRDYVGPLYPPGTKPRDYLARYAEALPTIELNSTYYGYSRERIEKWAAAACGSFRFCPKLPGAVTHERRLVGADAAMTDFLEAVEGFGADRTGPVWGVLPESFGPESFDALERFLDTWADRVELALELRHPAWFANPRVRERVRAAFEARGVIWMMTDVAGRRDVLHMHLTSSTAMIRFVGNALHATDFSRLNAWLERFEVWRGYGAETVYLFLHQHRDVQTVDLARHVAARYRAAVGGEPDFLAGLDRPPPPSQGSLF